MRIIFFGTPEFAVPSLEILFNAGYEIVGVVTSVDKLGGRGRKTKIESAIKKKALQLGLNILQPQNLKSGKFIEELKGLEADIQVIVAFRMLPEIVWNMPPRGTYNLHGSLLPAYRGAAPINWAIINGEKKTGVTTFKLAHAIDTGKLLFQKELKIYPGDTAGDIHDRMMWVGADLVYETIASVALCEPKLMAQDESKVSKAPKLNETNTQINFNNDSWKIVDQIRGLSPYPGAWFRLDGKKTKVYSASAIREDHDSLVGLLTTDNKSYLKISTRDGYIEVSSLQMSGKKKMSIKDFLNGYNIKLS